MLWYHYVAYFFGGAFLGNAVPHFTSGVMGRPFPSPFASPPGKGLSSPSVNVLWGFLNAVVGYSLLCYVGSFSLRDLPDIAVAGIGALLISVMLAQHFGSVPMNR
jgi:hypothetical protein